MPSSRSLRQSLYEKKELPATRKVDRSSFKLQDGTMLMAEQVNYALLLQPSTLTILCCTMARRPSRASVRYCRGSK